MKFIKFILPAFLILFCSSESLFAWDSTAAKYMPLQVGNVWVYSSAFSSFYGGGSSYQRYKISGTQLINGKVYYILRYDRVNISGTYSCGSRLFSGNYAIRIDSVNMNLYRQSACSSSTEGLVDSLASGLGDTSFTCFNVNGERTALNDTSDYLIFNTYYNAKKFSTVNVNGGIDQTYLEGIGLARYYFSVSNEMCIHNLKGCVINGVVYGDTSMIVGIKQISTEIPGEFSLSQNYPNPFNPFTKIKFAISGTSVSQAFLSVYDLLGREVAVLVNQQCSPAHMKRIGTHRHILAVFIFTNLKAVILVKLKKWF